MTTALPPSQRPNASFFALQRLRSSRGFSLVEVTLALGVAAVCLLAIFGLLPIGLNSNQTTVEQTTAASLARAIVADLRSTPTTSGTSPNYGLNIPTNSGTSINTVWLTEWGMKASPNNQAADPKTDPKYRAQITLNAPQANQKTATFVRLVISWPALADKNPPKDSNDFPIHAAGTFEAVTTLDRN